VSPAAAVPVDCLCRCGRSSDSLTDRLIDVQFPGIQPAAVVTRVSCTHALQRTVQFGRSYVVTVWSLLRGHSWFTPMVTVSVQCAVYDCDHTPREKARMILPILPLFVLSDFHVLYEPFVLLFTVV